MARATMPTIIDVARESGVSVATVSYVLNDGPRPVRPATRQRVLDAVRRLGYHPNAMARGLVRRRMDTLGVLFGAIEPGIVTNPYAVGVLAGVFLTAAETGQSITLFTQPWVSAEESTAPFRDRRTDGVLMIAPLTDSDMLPAVAGLDVPLVVISPAVAADGIISVDVDNIEGARLATEHLLALGHRHIVHVTGNANQPSVPPRREGFLSAMAAAGIACAAENVVTSAYNSRIGYAAIRHLLTRSEAPTAIFAGNDVLALAALDAARDLGIAVPERLSIVGFDDIPAASLVTPPLTTVRQPLTEIGRQATRFLVARVNGEPVPARAHLEEPALVVRGSTARLLL
jgi:DNA-binding LacI/PurR family transcriptional regulator